MLRRPTVMLLTLASIAVTTPTTASHLDKPPLPFPDDGCSCAPDGNFRQCCEAHDRAYYQGGSKEQRKQADREFRQCIRDKGHAILDDIYYFGARVGGVPWLPTAWRWGFGYPFKKGHRGYTEPEKK
jgi:hypothetical protein